MFCVASRGAPVAMASVAGHYCIVHNEKSARPSAASRLHRKVDCSFGNYQAAFLLTIQTTPQRARARRGVRYCPQ
eukprot:4655457-Pyramimonas_sp.AAC.1